MQSWKGRKLDIEKLENLELGKVSKGVRLFNL